MLALLFIFAQATPPPPPDAATIMARVAANQDRSDAERAHYVYVQHARVTSSKGKTLHCEEITDTRIVPAANGSSQQLLHLDGRLLVKHNYIAYHTLAEDKHPEDHDGGVSVTIGDDSPMDRDLVENMRHNLIDSKSRDGLSAGLFPLTSKIQAEYDYTLASPALEQRNGRTVYHVRFEPKDKTDYLWKGDAWIDAAEYQPVLVRTVSSRKIPFAVRTLLGTSLPGLGFTVIYAPQPNGVWFPVRFGSEFKLHVLFFLNRQIVIDAQNRDFERTHVSSTIVPLTPQP